MADPSCGRVQKDRSLTQPTPHPNAGEERRLSRSPHPYHRRGASLLSGHVEDDKHDQSSNHHNGHTSSNSSNESGTDADDERGRFLKRLPAPPLRPHKGLRDTPFENPTPQPSPLDTPPAVGNDDRQLALQAVHTKDRSIVDRGYELQTIRERYIKRKRSEVVRRITEIILFFAIGIIVSYDHFTEDGLLASSTAITRQSTVVTCLYVLYPFRTAYQAKQAGYSLNSSVSRGFHIPSRFDPAPLLYPVFLPLLVSISLASMSGDFILLNVILGVSSLPAQSVPFSFPHADLNLLHWLLTLLPVTFRNAPVQSRREVLTLLYPLHIYTLRAIEYLTMTSLDPAEQQLLAATLIDLYIFAQSAQAEILKALLWLGAPLVFILCQKPLQWELALARIPSWRFRDHNLRPRLSRSLWQTIDRMICGSLAQMLTSHKFRYAYDSEDDEHVRELSNKRQAASNLTIDVHRLLKHPTTNLLDHTSASAVEPTMGFQRSDSIGSSMPNHDFTTRRRHTLPAIEPSISHSPRTTPSGRPKRSVTIGSQSFLALTTAQVAVRKWAYAAFVYAAVLFIVLGPIRIYVSRFSLRGAEPFGWAIGYLLGNISQFRSWVQTMGLDAWILLPDPFRHIFLAQVGWVEQLRQRTFGAANARLLLSAYCLLVLLAGLATVLQLSSVAEVDTRRKVFHGTMVIMLLPTVFIDPCFTSLALILILAIFLLLDLFRAAQLPPIAKPLTAFLAPYVDGRDHRGPVIVSHIFLLTGCAIPLWLSLAAVPRSGLDPWAGWEVNVRDVSMISGVVCVGMGDSAASLIGRRYGRHKWYWGGGKSLEGSLAFAVAVTVGLIAAYIWLRVGGWVLDDRQPPLTVLGKAWLAASGASLTEAVLTGANDNVVVPVALWLLVRGLRL